MGTAIRGEQNGLAEKGRSSLHAPNSELELAELEANLVQVKTELELLKQQLNLEVTERQRLEALVQNQAARQSLQEQEKRSQRQNALQSLGQRGIINRDLYGFFDEVTAIVATTLGTDFCALWELLPNHSAFVLGAAAGWGKNLVGTVTIDATARSFVGYTLHINPHKENPDYDPVITQDLALETRFRGDPFLHNHQVVSGVNVIVPTPQGAFGVMGVYHCSEQAFFPEEVHFLTAVGYILSAAIDRHHYESRLRLLERAINASQNGIVITDALESTNPIIYVNEGFERITGYKKEEAIAQRHNFFQNPNLHPADLAQIQTAIDCGRKCHFTLSNLRRDGSSYWYQLSIDPIYDEQGHLINFVSVQSDITDLKRAEMERDRFFTLSLDLFGIADFNGYFKRINPAFVKVLGYTEAEMMSQSLLNFVHPDDLDATRAEMQSLSEGKTTYYFENRYRCRDGSYRWLAWASAPDYEEGVLYTAAHDVTHLKELTAELKASQVQLHSILGSLKDLVWSFDLDNQQFIYLNQVAESLYGVSLDAFRGNPQLWLEMVHPEDYDLVAQISQQLVEQGTAKDLAYRIVQPSGEIRWLRDRAHLVYEETGKPIRIDSLVTNITEAKRVEASFQESEDRLRRIISTISDSLLVVDLQGRIKFVNAAATELLGRSPLELLEDNIGIPLEQDGPTEITLHRPNGESMVAEMRLAQITWEGTSAHLLSLQDITERYRSALALAESEEKYRRIVELTTEGIWVLNKDQQIVFVNQQLGRMLGYAVEELLDQDIFNFVDVTHEPRDLRTPFPSCGLPQGSEVHDFKFRRRDGSELWAIVSKSPFFDPEGHYTGELAILTDITERKAIEQALFDSEQRLEGILSSIQDVVWSTDIKTDLALYLNAATELVYERPLTDFFEQPNLWFELVHPEDHALVRSSQELLLSQGSTQVEYRIIRPSGEVRWLFRRAKVVYDLQGEAMRIDGIDSDVTERKLAAESLHFNATHDSLTGLPNRLLFLDRLAQALHRQNRRTNYCFAMLFLDLDGFKNINDSLGHACGDLLLKEIARRLQQCLRPCDTLARLGGDEFTMLIEDIHGVSDAIAVAERIHEQLTSPFNLEGLEIFTNTSIGIAMGNSDYHHPQELVRDADTAMYQAKAAGKSCYRVFDRTMHKQVVVRLQRENDLRRALERGEFQVYYQPIIALATEKLVGFEALIRWQHPDDGHVLPQEFIAIAEETGLIVPIGRWVLQEACRQIVALKAAFPDYADLKISVNISSRQIRDRHLLQDIDHILQKTGLEPKTLKLEITESLLMDNFEVATDVLLALRQRQIEICLDDFGTG
ncbi:MAG: PAS domain S-box protein, partial [Microcystaceae cyanobacterium]